MNVRTASLTLAACAALMGATGCGSADGGPGTDSAAVTQSSGGAIAVPGDAPVDTSITIDGTAVLHGDRSLAQAYRAAALAASETTITRGGTLSITMFGQVGARSLVIHQENVPPLSQEGQAVRGPGEANRRAQIAAGLDIALGLAPASGDIQAQIDALTKQPGSDIARSIGDAMGVAESGQSSTKVVLALTDGKINHDGKVDRALEHMPVDRAGRRIASEVGLAPDAARVDLLRIAGIGQTSGRPDPNAEETALQVAMWRSACAALPVEICEVAATPTGDGA
jgi:hypothetical protein